MVSLPKVFIIYIYICVCVCVCMYVFFIISYIQGQENVKSW